MYRRWGAAVLGAAMLVDGARKCSDGTDNHQQQPSNKSNVLATKTAESGEQRAETKWRQWHGKPMTVELIFIFIFLLVNEQ